MARIDIAGFVTSFIRQNPNLPEDQLRVGLKNALQDQKRNGVKISSKEMAKANEMLSQSLLAQNAQVGITVAPEVEKATKAVASQQAVQAYEHKIPQLTQNQYDMLQYDKGYALKARQEMFQQELQEAFGVDKTAIKRTTKSSHFVNMARIDIADFVTSFVRQNPNLSEDQLRVGLRNALQDQKRNGVKISPKEMAKANEMLSQSLLAQNAQIGTAVAPKVKKATKTTASQQAVQAYEHKIPRLTQNQYDMLQYNKGNALKTRREMFQQELQEAFGVDKKAVQRTTESSHFVENVGNKAARRADLLDGMIDKEHLGAANFEEHLDSLSVKERKVALEESSQIKIEPYVSSKKAKQMKKAQEKASQLEHQAYRETKELRNARYCTQNGIMTHDAKKIYNEVLSQSNGQIRVNVNTTAPIKSAEESAKAFIENSVKPIEEAATKGMSKGGKIAIAAAIVLAAGTALGLFGKKKEEEEPIIINPQQMQQNRVYVA